ncbi:MAG: tetratricopeptide repeat protein [Methanosarcinales archaeon]|nr:MAG: tetratricopeptide repeat protein [Methanosarcinales archaeon]
MKKIIGLQATLFILFCGITLSWGQQTISEEAKRHFDRGMAAVEMAKSPDDYAAAIKEFEQAIRLAPNWPDVYYNLGLVQEKAGKFKDAAGSLRQYLKLAPNSPDAEAVRTLADKLEFKAEQVITDEEALDIFVSLTDNSQWQLKGITNANLFSRDIGWVKWFRRSSEPGRQNRLEFEYFTMYNCPTRHGVCEGSALPMGKVVEFQTHYKVCEGDGCLSTYNYRLEIMSRNKVKMFLRVHRGKEIGGGTSEASYEFVRR